MPPKPRVGDISPILDKVEVQASTVSHPSEDLDKVKEAVSNILRADIKTEKAGEATYMVSGAARGGDSIAKIRHGLRARQVLMTARRQMKSGIQDSYTRFALDKQAAYAGVVSIAEEGDSALGPIWVKISAPQIRKLIDWMTLF